MNSNKLCQRSSCPTLYQDQVNRVEGSSSTRSSFDIESGLKSIFGNLYDCLIGTINLNINADIVLLYYHREKDNKRHLTPIICYPI